ncbi:MAG TPA: hypothetical protein VGZ47_08925, partial [Gemmataceae bacterium]|nr:hypothetical protein [Gemmataceae bacterium]
MKERNRLQDAVSRQLRSQGMNSQGRPMAAQDLAAAGGNIRSSMGGGGAHGAQVMGAGMPGMGISGIGMGGNAMAAAGPAVALLAAAKVMEEGFQLAAKAAVIWSNTATTEAQKQRQFGDILLRKLPWPLGDIAGAAIDVRDAKVQDRLRINREQHEIDITSTRLHGERNRLKSGLEMELWGGMAQHRAIGAIGMPGRQMFDLSTGAGQAAYDKQSAIFPAEQDLVRARRGELGAGQELFLAQQKKQQQQFNVEYYKNEANKAERAANRGIEGENRSGASRSPDKINELNLKAIKAQEALLQQQKMLEQDITRENEKRLNLMTAQSNVRRAQIGLDRANLAHIKEQESRSAGTAAGLGMMGAGGRMMGLHAARLIKNAGANAGMLPPELWAHAAGFAPDWTRKEAERVGSQSPEALAGSREGFFPQGDPTKLAELQRQKQQLEAKIDVKIELDTAK